MLDPDPCVAMLKAPWVLVRMAWTEVGYLLSCALNPGMKKSEDGELPLESRSLHRR